jgi:hypothetical protein
MSDVLGRALESAGATIVEGGGRKLPEGKTLTVYVAHGGATLTVGKVVGVKIGSGVAELVTTRGEIVFAKELDLVGAMVTGTSDAPAGKKAGFL